MSPCPPAPLPRLVLALSLLARPRQHDNNHEGATGGIDTHTLILRRSALLQDAPTIACRYSADLAWSRVLNGRFLFRQLTMASLNPGQIKSQQIPLPADTLVDSTNPCPKYQQGFDASNLLKGDRAGKELSHLCFLSGGNPLLLDDSVRCTCCG